MLKEGQLRPAIDDPAFALAVELLHAGDAERLRAHLGAHSGLVTRRATGSEHPEYRRGYFARPTLLHFTAYNPWWVDDIELPANLVEATQVILRAGAEVDALSGDDPDWQWTTLGLVTSGNKPTEAGLLRPMMELLIAHGADPNGGVLGAISHSKWDAFDILLEHDLDRTPFVLAALGDVAALESALTGIDHDGLQRALFAAVVRGHVDCVTRLVDAGADPNVPLPIHRHATAMHQAAYNDQGEVLRCLHARGGRLDVPDTMFDATPLQWAEYNRQPLATAVLLELEGGPRRP